MAYQAAKKKGNLWKSSEWQRPRDRRLAVKKHTEPQRVSLWFFLLLIPIDVIFFSFFLFLSSFFFFFQPPATTTGSYRGRRNIFFHGHGCAPTRGMRRGSSVESFLMTEQNDRFELDGRGTEQPPTFHTNLSDLLANLDPNVFFFLFLFFFFFFRWHRAVQLDS